MQWSRTVKHSTTARQHLLAGSPDHRFVSITFLSSPGRRRVRAEAAAHGRVHGGSRSGLRGCGVHSQPGQVRRPAAGPVGQGPRGEQAILDQQLELAWCEVVAGHCYMWSGLWSRDRKRHCYTLGMWPVSRVLSQPWQVRWRLFRESCCPYEGNYVKDLMALGRPLATTIIVDNRQACFTAACCQ